MKALLIAALFAQTAPTHKANHPTLPTPTKPTIPLDLQNKFHKRQSTVLVDTMHVEHTAEFKKLEGSKSLLDEVMQEMVTACGPGMNVQVDQDNDASCLEIPKPQAPNATEKPNSDKQKEQKK
jgi:hypothetical protein